ncbi:hypothetical protein WN51_12545 [Melipona quadrifasciata]|uniref:Uncharacterized protein n=1 Tax=Melipona quadrifasciata TaxID=166423 RepID=A0A0M9A2B7_9HYME|nr:hypothetical protein WN51_12545 [Melipona quadrifasciata]
MRTRDDKMFATPVRLHVVPFAIKGEAVRDRWNLGTQGTFSPPGTAARRIATATMLLKQQLMFREKFIGTVRSPGLDINPYPVAGLPLAPPKMSSLFAKYFLKTTTSFATFFQMFRSWKASVRVTTLRSLKACRFVKELVLSFLSVRNEWYFVACSLLCRQTVVTSSLLAV